MLKVLLGCAFISVGVFAFWYLWYEEKKMWRKGIESDELDASYVRLFGGGVISFIVAIDLIYRGVVNFLHHPISVDELYLGIACLLLGVSLIVLLLLNRNPDQTDIQQDQNLYMQVILPIIGSIFILFGGMLIVLYQIS
jgi:hypothetical protein